MEINLTTPALLFSTISLLLLAYNNRFIAITNLIRGLKTRYQQDPNEMTIRQINSLRKRIFLIRNMQLVGILSLLLSVGTMFLLFAGWDDAGAWLFGISLVMLIISMAYSAREILISVDALNLELSAVAEFGIREGFMEAGPSWIKKGISKLGKKTDK